MNDSTRLLQASRDGGQSAAGALLHEAYCKLAGSGADGKDRSHFSAHSAFVDEKGWLKDGYSGDGLHPNAKGYELMAPIAEAAIQKALAH